MQYFLKERAAPEKDSVFFNPSWSEPSRVELGRAAPSRGVRIEDSRQGVRGSRNSLKSRRSPQWLVKVNRPPANSPRTSNRCFTIYIICHKAVYKSTSPPPGDSGADFCFFGAQSVIWRIGIRRICQIPFKIPTT